MEVELLSVLIRNIKWNDTKCRGNSFPSSFFFSVGAGRLVSFGSDQFSSDSGFCFVLDDKRK